MRIFSYILMLSFVTSCQVARQADSALYSVANSVSSKDLITGQRKLNSAERRKQIAQGNAYVEKLVEKYREEGKKINEEIDSRQYDRLVRIFKNVHAISHLRHEEWQVYMIPEDSFNAFVTGGTSVVVHYGLMKDLSFDDEIAAVIGHEVAHVSANHVFERQAAMMAGLIGKSNSVKRNSIQAAYSHNDEEEADEVGILYAALAGYDPAAASRVWQKKYKKRGNDGQLYQSHPITSERLEMTKDVAEKVRRYYIPGKQNPNFENILTNNVLWQKRGESRAPGAGGGVAAVAETLAGYYIEKQNAKAEATRQTQRITILKNIQSQMKITNGKLLDNGQVAMQVQYTGNKPVGRLAIKAVSEDKSSLYRHSAVIRPGEKFVAEFSGEILKTKNGGKPKVKLVVDEGQYF